MVVGSLYVVAEAVLSDTSIYCMEASGCSAEIREGIFCLTWAKILWKALSDWYQGQIACSCAPKRPKTSGLCSQLEDRFFCNTLWKPFYHFAPQVSKYKTRIAVFFSLSLTLFYLVCKLLTPDCSSKDATATSIPKPHLTKTPDADIINRNNWYNEESSQPSLEV